MNSFSANILSEVVDLVTSGLRDLRSNDLSEFNKPLSPVSSATLNAKVTAVKEDRASTGLQSQADIELASQISTPVNAERFRKLLADAGVEATYAEDLIEADSTDFIPQIGSPTEFAQRKADQGAELSVADIRNGLTQLTAIINNLETPDSSLHITQNTLRIQADEDSRVFTGNNKMLDYVRQYTKVGQ